MVRFRTPTHPFRYRKNAPYPFVSPLSQLNLTIAVTWSS